MRKMILLSLILLVSVSLMSCGAVVDWLLINLDKNGQYYLGAGWDCNDETFANEYYPLYYSEIQRLKALHGLECQERVDWDYDTMGNPKVTFYLYCEEYTFRLKLLGGSIGYYDGYLYYYAEDRSTDKYEEFKPLVEFLNDFTNYAAYDTKTDCNHFEKMFNDAISNGEKYSSFYYHYDSVIGNVGYYVQLTQEKGYYYMAEFNSDIEKTCYLFSFDGLLKPLL